MLKYLVSNYLSAYLSGQAFIKSSRLVTHGNTSNVTQPASVYIDTAL